MLKENFKNKLIESFNDNQHDNLNVGGLISFMENSDVNYYMADLNGPMGMATINGVYIDINNILSKFGFPIGTNTMLLYFIILHETAHMKRIIKLGKDKVLEKLSLTDFNDFFEHIINEELIADNYGCLIYYLLNKKKYPSYYTQNLGDADNKERYKQTARGFYGQIQNDETKYNKLVNRFIKKIY
jgi:hypothetical protein